jgi:hypothetical protein
MAEIRSAKQDCQLAKYRDYAHRPDERGFERKRLFSTVKNPTATSDNIV